MAAVSLVALGAVISSCQNQYRVKTGKNEEKKIFNLKYGPSSYQVMDVFLPAKREKEDPAVIIVHGGSWKIGRKEHMKMIQNFLHRQNIATVNINYRLVNRKITYKDQVEDIGLAVRKLNEIAEAEGISKNNYILLGESSGAHIALLYGYQNPVQIKKIISLSGPTDFYTGKYMNSFYSRYSSRTIQDVVGVKFDRDNLSDEFKKASPVAQVSNVPTLLFQGDRDILVHRTQASTLDSVLEEKEIEHRLILMKNTGHVPRLLNKRKREEIIFPNILEWIKK